MVNSFGITDLKSSFAVNFFTVLFRSNTFATPVSPSPVKRRRIAESDNSANMVHLLVGLRSSVNNLEKRMEYIFQEIKEIKETMQVKMMSPSECLHGLCALGVDSNFIPFAPAKTEEELLKVIHTSEVVSIFYFCFFVNLF